jgi:hypothetical protein
MDETRLQSVMKPENLLKAGFTIGELFETPDEG